MTDHDLVKIFERHESRVRTYCRRFPVVFDRARGSYLWDTTGQRYVDLLCGSGSLNYGHNPPKITDRVVGYLLDGGLVHSMDFYTTAKAEFLHTLWDTVLRPRGLGDYLVQFPGPAGTLAVEAALKLARKVSGRADVIAFHGGFHGASLGALAATTSALLRAAAGTALRDVTLLPYGDGSTQDAAEILENAAARTPPAAILLETIQGEGGLRVASRTWLARVRQVADAVDALVIVDDIQAGCGRTGTFFSFDDIPELRPDLVCLSKSLSGMGQPMAALLIRPELDQWVPGEHNGTFRGYNLAFVGGTAALDYWADPGFTTHAVDLGIAIRTALDGIVTECPAGSVHVVGQGAMSGLRFTDAETTGQVQQELFRALVIAETAGEGRVLKFYPPLTMTLAEWEEVASIIGQVVRGCVATRPGSH